MTTPTFYLGAHIPAFLERTDAPLFISRRRLYGRKSFPRALGRWALDSGAFTQLNRGAWYASTRGPWDMTAAEYGAEVSLYADAIGNLDWAAPMDWPCEPHVIWKNGVGIPYHQRRTVENYVELRELDLPVPIIPVLQGWELSDYHRCAALYADAGVDLTDAPVVGVGSICRRGQDSQIKRIMRSLWDEYRLPMHAFGVRGPALRDCSDVIASADSMAWSLEARHKEPLPGCTHRNCANCLPFALRWRDRRLTDISQLRLEVA